MRYTAELLSTIVIDNEVSISVKSFKKNLPAMLLKNKVCFPLKGSDRIAFISRAGSWLIITFHFFVGLYKQSVNLSCTAKPV